MTWALRDGYCRLCRKMIPMGTGQRLIVHYTFVLWNASVDGARTACEGVRPDNTITHFMDDPKAAFE